MPVRSKLLAEALCDSALKSVALLFVCFLTKIYEQDNDIHCRVGVYLGFRFGHGPKVRACVSEAGLSLTVCTFRGVQLRADNVAMTGSFLNGNIHLKHRCSFDCLANRMSWLY